MEPPSATSSRSVSRDAPAVPQGVVCAAAALAVLRIGSSRSWLKGALLGTDAKWRWDFLSGHGLAQRIVAPGTGFSHSAVTPGINHLLTSVVLPHAAFFAWMIAVSELAIGTSLATGTLARLGGLLAILRAITNVAVGGLAAETVGHNWMLGLAGLVVLIAAAGRSYGIDALLTRRYPQSRLLRLVA